MIMKDKFLGTRLSDDIQVSQGGYLRLSVSTYFRQNPFCVVSQGWRGKPFPIVLPGTVSANRGIDERNIRFGISAG